MKKTKAEKAAKSAKPKQELFPKIGDATDAMKLAKGGALAGLIFTGMIALGAAITIGSASGVSDNTSIASEDLIYYWIAYGVEAALILLASWRVYTGKGLISGALMASLFALEISAKYLSQPPNVGWMFFHGAVFLAFLNGLRGLWYLRSQGNAPQAIEAAPGLAARMATYSAKGQ